VSPLLGFKAEFAEAVRDGRKRQTIRACRKDRRDPKPGQTLYLWTRLRHRTLPAIKLGEVTCKSVRSVMILEPHATGFSPVRMGDRDHPYALFDLDRPAQLELAKADGFESCDELRAFIKKAHGLPFRRLPFWGLVIRW
jgi:hypothetical protein